MESRLQPVRAAVEQHRKIFHAFFINDTPPAEAGTPYPGPRQFSLFPSASHSLKPLPRLPFVTEMKTVGMKYFRQNFERLNHSRAGPVEILIAVREENAPLFHRPEFLPVRFSRQRRHFRDGLEAPQQMLPG